MPSLYVVTHCVGKLEIKLKKKKKKESCYYCEVLHLGA